MDAYLKEIFIENKELKDINPRTCGESQCVPGHSWGPSFRSYFLLHYVMSGRGVYKAPTKTYEVCAGQIFVIFPGETVTYIADEHDPWQYCWVSFEAALDLSGVLSGHVLTVPECRHIFHALSDCANTAVTREWYICGKIYELLSLLGTQRRFVESRAHRYVCRAQNYIEIHYQDTTLRVDTLAEKLNLDRTYFSKIFHKYTGKPPQGYIVDFRLDRAAELLVHQKLSPGEVAVLVGYGDIFNFSRMFRRRFGVPPSAYLAMRQKLTP